MQIVSGRPEDGMTIRDVLRQVPTRMIRFVKRIAQLQRGRYIVYLAISDDGVMSWSVSTIEKIEQ